MHAGSLVTQPAPRVSTHASAARRAPHAARSALAGQHLTCMVTIPHAPWTPQDYRLLLVYALRRAKVIDGAPVSPQELAAARGKYSGRLTLEFLVGAGRRWVHAFVVEVSGCAANTRCT